jgi:hypothetical protein
MAALQAMHGARRHAELHPLALPTTETLMRVAALTSLVVLAIGTMAAGPVRAQTYDPSYPVCLHVFGEVAYFECRYTSLPQCAITASGRSAECVVNPYAAKPYQDVSPRHHRRYRRGH